jgi:hypothetical protein
VRFMRSMAQGNSSRTGWCPERNAIRDLAGARLVLVNEAGTDPSKVLYGIAKDRIQNNRRSEMVTRSRRNEAGTIVEGRIRSIIGPWPIPGAG